MLNADEQKALIQAARNDFGLFFLLMLGDIFTMFGFTEQILQLLDEFEKSEKFGFAIAAPPRSGKTEMASVLFSAWHLGRHPSKNIALVSYSEDRSIDNTMKVRDMIMSDMYKKIFPEIKLKKSQTSKKNFATTKKGTVYALGRNSPVSGRTFHLILIDDFIKEPDEIYSEATRLSIDRSMDNLRTRITNQTRVGVIGTRWFTDDPVGTFFLEAEENPDDWVTASFPAVATEDEYSLIEKGNIWRKLGEPLIPELTSLERYMSIKKKMDPNLWEALYQQSPMGDESHFKKEWISYTGRDELNTNTTRNYLAVDPAMSTKQNADNTGFCIVHMDQEGYWHTQAWGEKLPPRELIERIFELHGLYNFQKIGIEKTQFLNGVKPFLDDEMRKKNEFLPVIELSHNQRAKEARILGALPALYASGTIKHVEGECAMLEKEMFSFPKGKHDDVLDATAYMAIMLTGQRSTGMNKINYTNPLSRSAKTRHTHGGPAPDIKSEGGVKLIYTQKFRR